MSQIINVKKRQRSKKLKTYVKKVKNNKNV